MTDPARIWRGTAYSEAKYGNLGRLLEHGCRFVIKNLATDAYETSSTTVRVIMNEVMARVEAVTPYS